MAGPEPPVDGLRPRVPDRRRDRTKPDGMGLRERAMGACAQLLEEAMNDDLSAVEDSDRNARWRTDTSKRIILTLLLALAAAPAVAIDLGLFAQRLTEHERWTSLEFRDPVSGIFIASRAGTEDPRARATLTLTASPAEICLPDIVIVYERAEDSPIDIERADILEWQLDRRRAGTMPIRIVRQQGDRFEFVQFDAALDLNKLAGRRVLRFRNPPELRAEFSLRGFSEAWRAARSVCEDFLPSDEGAPFPGSPLFDPDEFLDV